MKWLALLLVATSAHAAPPILGGTPAAFGDYPSVVILDIHGALCTGEVIAPNWILTAGHCVTPSLVGAATQQDVTDSIFVFYDTVSYALQHSSSVTASDSFADPDYNPAVFGNHDMGLIQLKTPIPGVRPAPVNFDPAAAPVGVPVTLVGFGKSVAGSGGSAGVEFVLKNRASVPCATLDTVDGITDAEEMCYDQSDGKGQCQGDSGGPSFAMIYGQLTIVATTSFGDDDCAVLGVDRRTDAERAFLLAHVPSLQCAMDSDCSGDEVCFRQTCLREPFSDAALGDECESGADCDSGSCIDGAQGKRCSFACTTECPTDFACQSGNCYATKIPSGGCCDAGGAPTTMLAGLAIFLTGARARRSRRRGTR